jgi:hypothetical protein
MNVLEEWSAAEMLLPAIEHPSHATTVHALSVAWPSRGYPLLVQILSLPASCIGGVVGCILYQLLLSVASSGVRDFVQQHLLAGWDALPSLLTVTPLLSWPFFPCPRRPDHPPHVLRPGDRTSCS